MALRGALRKAKGPVLQRAGWGITDQVLSSVTNFGLSIVVARSVSPVRFGTFSVAYTAYVLVMGLTRAIVLEPLTVRYSAASTDERRRAAASAAGFAIVLGVLAGAACAAIASVVHGSLGAALAALAVVFPGLLLQDAWRFVFFTWGRPSMAALNDGVWALVMFPAVLWLVAVRDEPTVPALVLAWGLSAAAAALVGLVQARVLPRPERSWAWLVDHRALSPYFAVEYVTMTAAGQVTSFALAAVSGVSALGALRASQVVMGPLNVAFLGATAVTVPEGVRLRKRSPHRLLAASRLVSAAMGATALCWGAAALALPTSAGRALLGATWDSTRPLLLPMTLRMMAVGTNLGSTTGLRVLGSAKRSLTTRALMAPVFLGLGVGGALVGGAFGAATGMAIAQWAAVVLWRRQFRVAWRQEVEGRRGSGAGAVGEESREPAAHQEVDEPAGADLPA